MKALNHLLQSSPDGENADAINLAVDVVGQAGEQQLTTQVINYLMGDFDGMPKVRQYSWTPGEALPA